MLNEINWEVPEFQKQERSRTWYIIAGLIAFLMIFFSFFSLNFRPLSINYMPGNSNFMFALIIVLFIIIMIITESREAKMVKVKLDGEGLELGNKFYDYDKIKNFCVLYKPKEGLKNLYFELKNVTHFRISLPLNDLDALEVRNFLKRFLDEDLERTAPPISEQLTKLLKL